MTSKEIINLILENNFTVYGNGFIAKRFLKQIYLLGCESHLASIAVTKASANEKGFNGVPVVSIDSVDRKSLLFIATHDSTAMEMKEIAVKLGFSRIVSIYYYLFDMEIGEPVQRDLTVKTNKLILNLHSGCMPAVYFLSMCDYVGSNKYNGSLYIKAYMHFSSQNTAKKRWNRFKEKIDDFQKNGYNQDYNVKISKDYCLMDGLHRLILAKYYGVDTLRADVYDCDVEFFKKNIFDHNTLIPMESLSNYYKKEEVKDIIKAYEAMRLR